VLILLGVGLGFVHASQHLKHDGSNAPSFQPSANLRNIPKVDVAVRPGQRPDRGGFLTIRVGRIWQENGHSGDAEVRSLRRPIQVMEANSAFTGKQAFSLSRQIRQQTSV
jgi:hypothetical protein